LSSWVPTAFAAAVTVCVPLADRVDSVPSARTRTARWARLLEAPRWELRCWLEERLLLFEERSTCSPLVGAREPIVCLPTLEFAIVVGIDMIAVL